ncbi:MAG: ParB/RepB/Spo0J family partition protein [Acidobacteria bacterium]|nr:ParB/RepB/Spo0J family partition protein [Acidobacteriota bacterium]
MAKKRAKKSALGRGLDALFSEEPLTSPRQTELALDDLAPNDYQPRRDFDAEELTELAASIRTQGLIQPILVTPGPSGGYIIVAGERRWRAAREAGLSRVPVVVRDVASKREFLEASLVENLQRSDLNAIEEAEAFVRLQREFGLSHEEIAGRMGKSRSAVSNRIRLLGLPGAVQSMIRRGELTVGQARPLLSLPRERDRILWARRAVKDGLNARQLEAATRRKQGTASARTRPAMDPDTRDASERLTKHLQTQVEIRRTAKGGRLVLVFHSEDELIRLYDMLMSTGSRG